VKLQVTQQNHATTWARMPGGSSYHKEISSKHGRPKTEGKSGSLCN